MCWTITDGALDPMSDELLGTVEKEIVVLWLQTYWVEFSILTHCFLCSKKQFHSLCLQVLCGERRGIVHTGQEVLDFWCCHPQICLSFEESWGYLNSFLRMWSPNTSTYFQPWLCCSQGNRGHTTWKVRVWLKLILNSKRNWIWRY